MPRASGPARNTLFHCPNLQGVILGVGLSMIEQMFFTQTNNSTKIQENSEDSSRMSKRRKTGSAMAKDIEDEDDAYYATLKGSGKGGIGYAGDQKEDVRVS
jgi:hypothetical protein